MPRKWEVRSVTDSDTIFGMLEVDVPPNQDWVRIAIPPENWFSVVSEEIPPLTDTMEYVDLKVMWREKSLQPCLACTSKDAAKLRRSRYFQGALRLATS